MMAGAASPGEPPAGGAPREGDLSSVGGGARGRMRRGPAHDVFVSHTSADSDKVVADAIVARLEQAGIRCWIAARDVLPGAVYAEAIIEAIATTRVMVVVLSGEANQSRHVHREVERAVASNVVVIPFRTEAVEPSGAMAYFLASEHWLDAMTPPLESHIARLVQVVGVLLEAPLHGPGPSPADTPRQVPSSQAGLPAPTAWAWWRRRWWAVAAVAVAAAGLAAGLTLWLLPPASAPKNVSLDKLAAGNCLQTPAEQDKSNAARARFWDNSGAESQLTMPVVSCQQSHSGEVYFARTAWPASQSSWQAAVVDQAYNICDKEFQSYVGVKYLDSYLRHEVISPGPAQWDAGYRKLVCIAYDPSGSNSQQSVRNIRR